ncbi:hypothetical protein MKZ38_003467 [Zalerion maritima]|uniref:Uncharacterized protein n=1 Tax=Zalerion maritima TaxID=339359 RepID=A0AAD5RYD3_9PEZI|nr:hypothetical protein MKZ38_003467 [Zalerion maritima]
MQRPRWPSLLPSSTQTKNFYPTLNSSTPKVGPPGPCLTQSNIANQIPLDATPKLTTPALPTPTYGDGGNFSIICSVPISASPAQCLAVVLDDPSYPDWNAFVQHITIT